MKKVIQTEYLNYVNLGKDLVKKLNEIRKQEKCYQAQIAQYALSVCEIRHGGRSDGIYTISKYANDINLRPKTVQNWIQIYCNVVKKLKIENPTANDWTKATKVNNALRNERAITNKLNGKEKTRFAYKQDVPPERVKKIFDQTDEKPIFFEFQTAAQSAKHIKFLCEKRDLKLLDRKVLISLMETLDHASESINDFLTKTKPKTLKTA